METELTNGSILLPSLTEMPAVSVRTQPSKPGVKRSPVDVPAEKLEKIWLKAAGMQSDLTVHLGPGAEYALHRFPLYSKTDFFSQEAKDDLATGKTHVYLSDMPGGDETFRQVANFCYGLELEITPANIGPLLCAALYLDMTDDSRSGMTQGGNLVSLVESHLQPMLQSWEDALAVLRSSEGLQPHAAKVGLVRRCLEAVTGHGMSHPSESIHVSEKVLNLPLGLFVQIIESFREEGLSDKETSRAIGAYSNLWLPSSQELQRMAKERHMAEAEQCWQWRKLLETLVDLLPGNRSLAPLNFLLRMLKIAMVLDMGEDCRNKLRSRAGEHLDQATVEDLLPLDVSDVLGLLATFLAPQNLATQPDSAQALRNTAGLIDKYLKDLMTHGRHVSPEDFKRLATAVPEEARPNQDTLYQAMHAFLLAQGSGLKDKEVLELVEVISPSKLSEACVEAAANEEAWPLPFTADVLVWQKQFYADKAAVAERANSEYEAVALREREDARRLRGENAELRQRLIAAEATAVAVRSTLREEGQLTADLLTKEKTKNAELSGKVQRLEEQLASYEVRKGSLFRWGSKRRPPTPKANRAENRTMVVGPNGNPTLAAGSS